MDDKSVRFESDLEQGGFTAVPNVVLVDAELSVQSRLTYAMLRYYAWQSEDCWPGQKTLSGLLGCSERSLRVYVQELSEAGWVRVERRGLGRTNRYVLTVPDGYIVAGLDRKPASGLERKPASGPIEEDSVEEDSVTTGVREVFDYWRDKMIHPRAKLDSTRRSKIAARLRDGFTVDELKQAVDGCAESAWHMGDNPSSKKFDDIALICRDASKVESFIAGRESQAAGDWDKLLG